MTPGDAKNPQKAQPFTPPKTSTRSMCIAASWVPLALCGLVGVLVVVVWVSRCL